MGVHLENASLTDAAVVGTSWLQVVALAALAIPESSQVAHGLSAVLHKSLNVLLETLESIILNDGLSSTGSWFLVDVHLGSLSVFTILDLFPKLLILHEVLGATWLDNHGPKMIKDDVVEESYTN